MNRLASKRFFIAAALAGLGTAAMAQPAAQAPAAGDAAPRAERAGRGMDPAQMQQRMAERHAKRMTDLKAKLKLTPAQEGAWGTYTAAMQPPAQGMGMQRPNPGEMQNLTTPQRIDRMQAMSAQRQAQMTKRADATKAFYATLTPEQQKVFDAEGSRHFGRGGMGERGQGHRGHDMHGGPRG